MSIRLRTPIKPIEPVIGWLNGGPVDVTRPGPPATLLHFWALSCGACKEQMPAVRRWVERFGPRGLRVVGIHIPLIPEDHDVAEVEERVRDLALRHPIALDQEGIVAAAYEIRFVPSYFVYDQALLLRHRHAGYEAAAPTERAIERVLSETGRAAA